MAAESDLTAAELAVRLTDYADAVDNPAHHDMEQDLRDAARRLLGIERPARALLPALAAELERVAAGTTDEKASHQIRELIGA